MNKVRTILQLQDQLDTEISWRRKELLTIRLQLRGARSHVSSMLRRSGIALLYAHWEGFLKTAGTIYLNFVSHQGLHLDEVSHGILAVFLKQHFGAGIQGLKGRAFREFAEFCRAVPHDRLELNWKHAIQTKSNITIDVLQGICAFLDLDYGPFSLREKQVVERLRETRNSIAHGQECPMDSVEFDKIYTEIVFLIDEVHRQLVERAETKLYRLAV